MRTGHVAAGEQTDRGGGCQVLTTFERGTCFLGSIQGCVKAYTPNFWQQSNMGEVLCGFFEDSLPSKAEKSEGANY